MFLKLIQANDTGVIVLEQLSFFVKKSFFHLACSRNKTRKKLML